MDVYRRNASLIRTNGFSGFVPRSTIFLLSTIDDRVVICNGVYPLEEFESNEFPTVYVFTPVCKLSNFDATFIKFSLLSSRTRRLWTIQRDWVKFAQTLVTKEFAFAFLQIIINAYQRVYILLSCAHYLLFVSIDSRYKSLLISLSSEIYSLVSTRDKSPPSPLSSEIEHSLTRHFLLLRDCSRVNFANFLRIRVNNFLVLSLEIITRRVPGTVIFYRFDLRGKYLLECIFCASQAQTSRFVLQSL